MNKALELLYMVVFLQAPQATPQITPPAPSILTHDNITIGLSILTLILTGISLWLAHRNTEAQTAVHTANAALNSCEARKNQLEAQITEFRKHAQKMTYIEYVYQDVVLLGPKHSGKTSTAELWTKPWVDIDGLPHTTQWKPYEASIFPIGTEQRDHHVFGVKANYERVLRVRIHDYPGEDEFRKMAVQNLPALKSAAVLLLFFDLEANEKGFVPIHTNNSYYSKAFVESIEGQRGLTSNLAKVIVVFNKVDLLPADWNESRMREELIAANVEAYRRIDTLFSGMMEHHFVSAATNEGLISLLGSTASSGLPREAKQRFNEHLSKLYVRASQVAVSDVSQPGAQPR